MGTTSHKPEPHRPSITAPCQGLGGTRYASYAPYLLRGIDVHQARLTACVRQVDEHGQVRKEVREFATTYTSLLALSDWLVAQPGPVAALESTGVYTLPGILPRVSGTV